MTLGANAPGFVLPLDDAGAGAVNTVLARGVGAATFTRATVAWTKLSTGLWAQVASGTARSTYFGMTTAIGSYAGYLAEAAATQLVTPTASIRDMTDASWAAVNVTAAKNATGIDGVANSASTLTCTSNGGTILQTLTAAASSRTYSAWIRRKTGTGAVSLTQGATTSDISGSINSTTYTQVSLTASVLNVAFGITFATSGDEIEIDFNQFEAGAFATSPLAAAGAARNADVLTYTFAGNADAAQGASYAELSTLFSTSNLNAAISFQSAANGLALCVNSTDAATVIRCRDGTNQASKTGLTSMATAVRKRASSWGSGMVVTGDGAAVATATFDGDMGSTAIGIGCRTDGALSWYGTIKNVRIWRQQLSSSQLIALTA